MYVGIFIPKNDGKEKPESLGGDGHDCGGGEGLGFVLLA